MFLYLIVIVLTIIWLDRCLRRKYLKLHRQIGSDWVCLPIIGHSYKLLGTNEDIFNTIKDLSKQMNKNKYNSVSFWLGPKFHLAIGDPIYGRYILNKALDKTLITRFMYSLTGNGTAFAPNHISNHRRKVLAPTFAVSNVKKFIGVFETNAKEIVRQLEEEIGKGNFSSWDYIFRYTLDSVYETILCIKMNALEQRDNPISVALLEHFKIIARRLCKFWLYFDTLYQFSPLFAKQNEAMKIIHNHIDQIILKRLQENTLEDTQKLNKGKFTPFLDLILKCSEKFGKRYSQEELREETLVLIKAATEPSSTTICFMLLMLSWNQDVQKKIHDELDEVFGDTNEPIEFSDLKKLNYMEAVIKETLRLYPPFPLVTRDSKEDIILQDDMMQSVTVPRGCEIIVNIMNIHRNPTYWGPDADEFRPERFMTEDTNDTNAAFMPFVVGPRNCPGQLYAMLSIKVTIATILRRYRILPATSFKFDKANPLRLEFSILTHHVDHFDIQLESRYS